MLSFSFHLPNYRLKVTITKRRFSRSKKGIFETLKNIRTAFAEASAVRQGSRISRVFRPLFEQKKIRTILGGTLTLMVLTASVFSPQVSALSPIIQPEITTLSEGKVELTTNVVVRPPLDKVQITQGFHLLHPGVDFDGVTGDPVYPIMKGRVESVIYDRFGLGNHIILNHGSGIKSVYGHLSKVEVSAGEEVETKTEIGKVGSTGRAFGDHLHLEITDNDRHINPLTILPIK